MPIRWKLKEVAKDRGLTGYAVAALAKIERQTVYKLMRHPIVPRVDTATLGALCAALDCQPGDLLEYRKR